MKTRTIITALALGAATITGGTLQAAKPDIAPTPQHHTATCPGDVVVATPATLLDLHCNVADWQRLDIVGVYKPRCLDFGGNWGWRLQRCFNVDK